MNKKILKSFFAVLFLLALTLSLTACNKYALKTPTNLKIDEDTLELSWKKVPGSYMYSVSVGEYEFKTDKNQYDLTTVGEGEYDVKVKAHTNSNDYRDSKWSDSIHFVRDKETGLKFTLINSKTEYEVSSVGTASGTIVIPDTYRGKPVTSIGKSAFSNCNRITSLVVGKNVKVIKDRAFYSCIYLESVELPESLEVIEEYAFNSCSNIKELNIPSKITEISTYCFAYCRSITSLYIPENITKIGAHAFANLSGMTELDLGIGVTEIEEYGFANAVNLKELYIPENVKKIGPYSFYQGNVLESVTISDGLEEIGEYAFAKCVALESLILGNSITIIKNNAFMDNDSLKSVEIPSSVKEVMRSAFYSCDNLEEVTIGENVEIIGGYAFSETKMWVDSFTNKEPFYIGNWLIELTPYDQLEYEVKSGTIGIANQAFYMCVMLNTVLIPDSVKYIGEYAFYCCYSLTAIQIGNGVKEIRDYTFLYDYNLSYCYLGNGIERIGNFAFGECKSLTSKDLRLNSGLKEIGNHAFDTCVSLTYFNCPTGLEIIGDYAFKECLNLKTVSTNDNLRRIGKDSFMHTSLYDYANGVCYAGDWVVGYNVKIASTPNVDLEISTKGIADYAFLECSYLSSISMPKNLEYIGEGAFVKCNTLIQLEIPEKVGAINDFLCYDCALLSSVDIKSETIERIGRSAFYKCPFLLEVNLPESVKEIAPYAFFNDKGLINVNLENVEIIDDYAFRGCGLETVELSENLKRIGINAFANNENLKSVIVDGVDPEISSGAFRECANLETITILNGVKNIPEYCFFKCESVKVLDLGNVENIGNSAFLGLSNLSTLNLPLSIKKIDKYAFKGLKTLSYIYLDEKIEEIGDHAFYGCDNLTVYINGSEDNESWSTRWNSSFRPAVYGIELTQGYISSIDMSKVIIKNKSEFNTFNSPLKEGAEFKEFEYTDEDGNTKTVKTFDEVIELKLNTEFKCVYE